MQELEEMVMDTPGSVVPLELQKLKTAEEEITAEDLQSQYVMNVNDDPDPTNPIALINGERCFKNIIASPENYVVEPGPIDPIVEETLAPVLQVLKGAVTLIEAQKHVVRFEYHGLIRNQIGMQAWAKQMINEIAPEIENVVMCTERLRDPWD